VPADSSKLKALSLRILSISLVCCELRIIKFTELIGLNRIKDKKGRRTSRRWNWNLGAWHT